MSELLTRGMASLEGFGFPAYAVDDQGEVWSDYLLNGKREGKRGIFFRKIKQGKKGNGYRSVCIVTANGKPQNRYVHRLVLLAFVGECPQGQESRHLDGNPANNRLSNLSYGTRKQNQRDRFDHGTDHQSLLAAGHMKHPCGEDSHRAKLTEAKVREIRIRHKAGETVTKLAKEFEVSRNAVTNIVKGKTWKHVK